MEDTQRDMEKLADFMSRYDEIYPWLKIEKGLMVDIIIQFRNPKPQMIGTELLDVAAKLGYRVTFVMDAGRRVGLKKIKVTIS